MKKWIFSILISAIFFRGEIIAFQKRSPDSTSESEMIQERLGAGACESYQSSIKWGVAVGGIATAGVVFAIIMILSSSDPTLFSHDHS